MEMLGKGLFLMIIFTAKLTPSCCDANNFKFNFNEVSSKVEIQQREIATRNRQYVRNHANRGVTVYPHFNTILPCLLDLLIHWELKKVTLLTDVTYFTSDSKKLSVVEWFNSRGIDLLIPSWKGSEIMNIDEILNEERDVIIMCQTNHTETFINMETHVSIFRNWFIVQSKMPNITKIKAYEKHQFILVTPDYFGKSYEDFLNSEISLYCIFFVETLKRWDQTKFASWSSQKHMNLLSDFEKADADTRMKGQTIKFALLGEGCYGVQASFASIATLLNFNMTCVGANSPHYGIEINGSFDGMIGLVQRKEADLTGFSLAMQPNRARVVRYMGPNEFCTMSIWFRPPSARVSPISHLQVFSWATWICVFATVTIMVVVLAFALVTVTQGKFKHLKMWIISGQIVIDILNNMPGLPNKFLAGVLYLWVLAMFAHYNSVLKSFLIHKDQEIPFTSLEDVAERTDYRVILVKGAVLVDYFKYSKNPVHMKISERVHNNPENLVDSTRVSYVLCDEKTVLIELNVYNDKLLAGSETGFGHTPPSCILVNKPQVYFKTLLHVAFRKDFPYENIFRDRLQKLFESGILIRIFQSEIFNKKVTVEESEALSIFHMTVPIAILLTGIFYALIALMVEMLLYRRQ